MDEYEAMRERVRVEDDAAFYSRQVDAARDRNVDAANRERVATMAAQVTAIRYEHACRCARLYEQLVLGAARDKLTDRRAYQQAAAAHRLNEARKHKATKAHERARRALEQAKTSNRVHTDRLNVAMRDYDMCTSYLDTLTKRTDTTRPQPQQPQQQQQQQQKSRTTTTTTTTTATQTEPTTLIGTRPTYADVLRQQQADGGGDSASPSSKRCEHCSHCRELAAAERRKNSVPPRICVVRRKSGAVTYVCCMCGKPLASDGVSFRDGVSVRTLPCGHMACRKCTPSPPPTPTPMSPDAAASNNNNNNNPPPTPQTTVYECQACRQLSANKN